MAGGILWRYWEYWTFSSAILRVFSGLAERFDDSQPQIRSAAIMAVPVL